MICFTESAYRTWIRNYKKKGKLEWCWLEHFIKHLPSIVQQARSMQYLIAKNFSK
jgi:hypothetical protein